MADYPCPRCESSTSTAYHPGVRLWAICDDCIASDLQRLREQVEYEASFDNPREEEE